MKTSRFLLLTTASALTPLRSLPRASPPGRPSLVSPPHALPADLTSTFADSWSSLDPAHLQLAFGGELDDTLQAWLPTSMGGSIDAGIVTLQAFTSLFAAVL